MKFGAFFLIIWNHNCGQQQQQYTFNLISGHKHTQITNHQALFLKILVKSYRNFSFSSQFTKNFNEWTEKEPVLHLNNHFKFKTLCSICCYNNENKLLKTKWLFEIFKNLTDCRMRDVYTQWKVNWKNKRIKYEWKFLVKQNSWIKWITFHFHFHFCFIFSNNFFLPERI